ncbi:MAG: flavodoxin-dependent (E)-4-hydroxy-3-methylbut-2-enyl-diphosphate synthase [Coriobacteriales bacterium]|jgi:(E)-4-hydroxy-3-methylbut-2-enyl-diphosphate synthase|nr:flavodoxin-dependent (E)-4-hydroxy-3-methylbut-2-enyl-diphosphate synthase [Coriobacteriales bacterium]
MAASPHIPALPRQLTRQVLVGEVPLGGGAPLPVQSMLIAPTRDVAACLSQITTLAAAGCQIIRVAVESTRDLDPFEAICAKSVLPVVADIHFDYRLAVRAAERGAAKLRINPGNIGSKDKVEAVINAARAAGIPLRIGVNAGSLQAELREADGLSLADKMLRSARGFVAYFEACGFTDIVLSAKASDVATTIEAYRKLSQALPELPLHVGVTEAGTAWQGSIRSAVGIGTLLAEGIGDTLRVSLTADPVEELRVAHAILASLGLSNTAGPVLVSCPTCSRCKVDLIGIAEEVERRLASVKAPLKVAVMGCVVNGPGEAADADLGVACGKGTGALFSRGKVLYTVEESQIIDALFRELDSLLDGAA